MDINKAKDIIVEFIRDKTEESGASGAVIGISGGIDSALTAYLSVEALGKENVLGIHMPELNITPAEDVLDATEVAERLGIELKTADVSGPFAAFMESMPVSHDSLYHANGNLKARIRMSMLYYYANMMNRFVMGTGNKTEILLGYFTKYGDGGVDIMPLANLTKGEVYEWAKELNVPKEIIDRQPTAGLWEGQTDENEMGTTYNMIDRYIKGEEIPEEDKKIILEMNKKSQHKRELPSAPPIFREEN